MLLHRLIALAVIVAIFSGCAADPSVAKRQFKKKYSPTDPKNFQSARFGKVDSVPSPVTGKVKISKPYTVNGVTYYPLATAQGFKEKGIASWYGPNFHGEKTANGETYNQMDRTAAHLTLPFNTVVEVKNLENGKITVVRINDRGPFAKNRVVDVSKQAAIELGMIKSGTARVQLTALPPGSRGRPKASSSGSYFVQAGSFSEAENAENAAKTRIPRAYREMVSIMPRDTKKGTMHRVIVGPFPNRARAAKAAREIRIYARTTAKVITRP